jgi:FdhD protein
MNPSSKAKWRGTIVEEASIHWRLDYITTEEPLEIRLVNPKKPLGITMQTPEADFELLGGFLSSEGVITQRNQLLNLSYRDVY